MQLRLLILFALALSLQADDKPLKGIFRHAFRFYIEGPQRMNLPDGEYFLWASLEHGSCWVDRERKRIHLNGRNAAQECIQKVIDAWSMDLDNKEWPVAAKEVARLLMESK